MVLGAVAAAAVVGDAAAAVAAAAERASRKQALTRVHLSWPPGRTLKSLNWYLSGRATREDRSFVLSYILQRLCRAIFSYGQMKAVARGNKQNYLCRVTKYSGCHGW